MNSKLATWLIVLIVVIFVGFIVFGVALVKDRKEKPAPALTGDEPADQWTVTGKIKPVAGTVKAVSIMHNGNIIIGGENFLVCYDREKTLLWKRQTDKPCEALCCKGDSILASDGEIITVMDIKGEKISEWGPFEDNAIITSLASSSRYTVFSDAGNRILMVLDANGRMKSLIGKSGEPFVVPSPYFDVAIDGSDNIYVANTGHRRIEKRSIEGKLLSFFGEAGMAPGAFSGCCNPAHFIKVPQGYITAEKGLNRIKILDGDGKFVEFVSSVNDFTANMPLDLSSADGKTVYAANPADSTVYIFRRK
jgi:hypothetical protein